MVPLVMIKLLRNRGSDGSLWYRHISSPPDSELIKLQNNCFSMFLITNISNITFGVTACKNKFPGSGELVLCFVKYPISRRRIVSLIRKAISTGDVMTILSDFHRYSKSENQKNHAVKNSKSKIQS